MWVLSARENAEMVWYSIIGEKTKEASNVIDYNINEEVTVNTTAVFNANNDTTTGMATVIPWVNAPKLIAQTSILWIDFNAGYVWWVKFQLRTSSVIDVPWNEDKYVYLDSVYSKTDERWPYDFKFVAWKWLIAPTNWTYKLECTFFPWWWWSIWFEADYQVIVWWEVLGTTSRSEDPVSITVNANLKKGQWAMFLARLFNWSVNSCQIVPICNVTVTKL